MFNVSRLLLLLKVLLFCTLRLFGLQSNMFKKKTVELFPPVSGTLMKDGQPLPGVKIKRSYEYIDITDGEVHDYTTTDSEGRFYFPELTMKSRHTDNIFRTNIIWQGIMVDPGVERSSREDDVFLWSANSQGIKHIAYFVEMLSELHCDTSNSEEIIDVYDAEFLDGVVVYPIRSICRWPERAEIEKRKAADIDQFGEMRNIDSYGHVNGLI